MTASTSATTAALSSLLLLGLTPALSAQWPECHKLLPNDGQAGDLFGSAVATDGTLVVVGAPSADDLGSSSGSAYILGAQSGAQHLELLPSNGAPNDQFGASVAVDGALVVVGAPLADGVGPDSGAAYVFDATTGLQVFKLRPSDAAAGDQFGYAVAMDGGLVVVGTLGAAYVFDVSTGQQLRKLLPAGGSSAGGFGDAVDIDAGLVVVGARLANGVSGFSGAAYIFDAASGNELHRLIALDGTAWAFFGASVGIDGSVVAIGAPEASPKGKHSGAAYQFDALTGQQTRKLVPSDGHVFAKFGSSVDTNGQHLVVGSEQNNASALFSSGSVYVYEVQSGGLVVKLVASDVAALDEFGGAVAVAGAVLVSGAARDDDMGDASGSAYVFDAGGCGTCPTPTVYCTPKVNSQGCTPAIGFSGTPSATDPNPFDVSASMVINNKAGLIFYGVSPASIPFQGGFLCVQPPIKRTPVQLSGGNPPPNDCSGTFNLDFNALIQGGAPNLTVGAKIYTQYWSRDPQSSSTTSLTDALEFEICP